MGELLTGTVAQAIAWIVSVGIVAFVSYGLAWTNWDDETKKKIGYVLTAVLTALVTSLATFIPDAWQAMKVLDAIFALLATVAGSFGAWHLAEYKAADHSIALRTAQAYAVLDEKRIAEFKVE